MGESPVCKMVLEKQSREISDVPVRLLGFVLEVEAEDENELGDKLYGYDDLEAQAELVGEDIDELREMGHDEMFDYINHRMVEEGYDMEDVMDLQDEQETVNGLLQSAKIAGCPVLFKTDGTNLAYPSGSHTTVPHFGHGASCEQEECKRKKGECGTIWRLFPNGDLIVKGDVDSDELFGRYRLREDVQISVSSVGYPKEGTQEVERIE